MSSSFLILHGLENHRPPEHWQHWLAERLRAAGHEVLYPGLPEPDAPLLPDWTAALHEGLAAMTGDERVVLCHSLACMLWLHAAPGLPPELRPGRVLLVAPPASAELPDHAATFRIADLDVAGIRGSASRELRIVGSDEDPYNPTGAAAMYADPLGVPFDLVPGAGHINPDAGYGPWPFALEWALGDA